MISPIRTYMHSVETSADFNLVVETHTAKLPNFPANSQLIIIIYIFYRKSG